MPENDRCLCLREGGALGTTVYQSLSDVHVLGGMSVQKVAVRARLPSVKLQLLFAGHQILLSILCSEALLVHSTSISSGAKH